MFDSIISTLQEKLGSLSDWSSSLEEQIASLGEKAAGLSDKLSGLGDLAGSLEERITALGEWVANIGSIVADLQAMIAAVRTYMIVATIAEAVLIVLVIVLLWQNARTRRELAAMNLRIAGLCGGEKPEACDDARTDG